MTDTLVPRALGWILVAGALVALVGAVTPPHRQWMATSPEEFLRLVAAHPAWTFLHGAMALGSVITTLGLVSLGAATLRTERGWLVLAAGVLFAVAAALWIVEVGFRLSVTTWAARELVRTDAIPELYAAVRPWSQVLFAAHMVLAYGSIAALGFGLLGAPSALPRWAAWLAVVYGAVAVPGLLTPAFQAPILIYVVPFVLGVAILRA